MLRENREEEIKKNFYKPWLKLSMIILFLVIVIIVFIKVCSTKEYIIEGNTHYSDDEIISMLITEKTDEYAPLLYLRHKISGTDNIPFIEYIDIELNSINSIKIYVYEKVICGCVEVMGRYMCFDKDGIIVESLGIREPAIPLITGLSFDSIIIGKKLDAGDDTIFNKILNLSMNINKYECRVDEIHFNTDLTVVLYSGESRALLGNRTSYEEVVKVFDAMLSNSDGQKLEYDLKYYDNSNKKVIAKPIDQD